MRIVAALLLLAVYASAHFTVVDTSKNYEVNIHAQLLDSLAITNYEKIPGQGNTPTHYDNAMSVRLFLDGHFTDAFQFAARVKVSTDFTNRDIADHFYNPNEGIPYNKQSDTKRTGTCSPHTPATSFPP